MTEIRATAFAYILNIVGELDQKTASDLMATLLAANLTDGNRTVEDEFQIFEAEQSISVDAVEWVKKCWAERSEESAKQFAQRLLDDFMTTLWIS